MRKCNDKVTCICFDKHLATVAACLAASLITSGANNRKLLWSPPALYSPMATASRLNPPPSSAGASSQPLVVAPYHLTTINTVVSATCLTNINVDGSVKLGGGSSQGAPPPPRTSGEQWNQSDEGESPTSGKPRDNLLFTSALTRTLGAFVTFVDYQ